MSENQRPLQAQFDVDDCDVDVVEGIGFEPGTKYRFTIEKAPTGKYMQYGAAKGGLYVLSKKCPKELQEQYQSHPDQFEIFTGGEINGQQALVPGRDFDKFKPFLTKTIDVGWTHTTDNGGKRLVFMSLNASTVSINPSHPEWESPSVLLARKLGYQPPDPKSKEKFSFSFLHPGVAINAEVEMIQRKGDTKERPVLVFDSIELAGSSGTSPSPQQSIVDDLDPEIKMTVIELADGKKTVVEVIKAVKEHLKKENPDADKREMSELLGKYSDAINKLKTSGEILG